MYIDVRQALSPTCNGACKCMSWTMIALRRRRHGSVVEQSAHL
jgi:hypothetical protein